MTSNSIYIQSIEIEQLRSFGSKQTIVFAKNNELSMWNVIIGDNGIGKTSVLRALSLMLFSAYGKKEWLKYVNIDSFVRNLENPPFVRIYTKEKGISEKGEQSRTEINFDFKDKLLLSHYFKGGYTSPVSLFADSSIVMFAYGAGRKMGNKGLSASNDFPALSLFNENENLLNIEEWLIQTDYKAAKDASFQPYKDKVIAIVKTILQAEEVSEIIFDVEKNPRVLFQTKFGLVPLQELSLGYKTLLAWVVDFAKGLLGIYPDSENALAEPAICLVDEIDLHIHPALQQKMIHFLQATFPKTQFIVTAHSPLVIQSAENANIIVLKHHENEVKVLQNPLDIQNWRTDQILQSDLFGLTEIRSPEIEQKMEKRRSLLRKESRTDAENIELADLENMY